MWQQARRGLAQLVGGVDAGVEDARLGEQHSPTAGPVAAGTARRRPVRDGRRGVL